MRARRLLLVLLGYVLLDVSNPFMPGVVQFVDGAIEVLEADRAKPEAEAPLVPAPVAAPSPVAAAVPARVALARRRPAPRRCRRPPARLRSRRAAAPRRAPAEDH